MFTMAQGQGPEWWTGQVCFGCLTPTLKVVELILAQPQNICKEFFEALGPFRKAGESCLNQTKKKRAMPKCWAAGKNPLGLALTCRYMYTIVPAGIWLRRSLPLGEGKIITFGNNRRPQRQRLHRTPQPTSKRVANVVWNSTDFTQVSPRSVF